MVQGREHPDAVGLRRRGWNWPPEPLRWAACQLLTSALRAIDARADRQIRQFCGPKCSAG